MAPVSAAGSESLTVAPVTADGPLFVTAIVYVTVDPAFTVATPSVLLIDRSAAGDRPSTSVAELSDSAGSVVPDAVVTVAVLERAPVAVGEIIAVKMYTASVPTGRLITSLMSPVPLGAQVAPVEARHVHAALLSALGSVSVTVTPVASDGPAFAATIE